MFHLLHRDSNWGGICCVLVLVLLPVAILVASEMEDEIRDLLARGLGHTAAPSPEEEDSFEYR